MLVSRRVISAGDNVSKIESDHTGLILATAHVEYPADKMRTDNIDDHAMAWGQRQSQTAIQSYFSAALLPERIDYVSAWGLNRSTPYVVLAPLTQSIKPNRARLIIDEYGLDVHNPVVLSAGFSMTNLSGSGYDVLNQPLNPPEENITGGYVPAALSAINDTQDTVITLLLNNVKDRPLAGVQTVLIHARDSVDTAQLPTLTTVIRQGGVDIATLTLLEVEKTKIVGVGSSFTPLGGIYRYEFDASILPVPNIPVQLRITGETTGSRSVDFLAVRMRSKVSGTLFDSSWQDVEAGDRVAWAPRLDFGTRDVGHYVIVEFSDYGLREVIGTGGGGSAIVDHVPFAGGSFRVGRFAAGTATVLPLPHENGIALRKVGSNQDNLMQTYGGFLRGAEREITRWEVGYVISPQSQSRLFCEIEGFLSSLGNTIPAAFVIDDENEPGAMVPAFYALVVNFEATDIGLQVGRDLPGQADFLDKFFDVRLLTREAAGRVRMETT